MNPSRSCQMDSPIQPVATREELEVRIATRLGRPVTLAVTDNVHSMMSFRPDAEKGVVLRLHTMFLEMSDSVLDDVVAWIRNPNIRSSRIRDFMALKRDRIRPARARQSGLATLRASGRYFHLHTLFARLNARFFDSRLEMRVTWGNKPVRRSVSSMKLGSFCPESGIITISPRLDSPEVPEYFVEFVLYHEMLHAAIGVRTGHNGRRRIHTPEFKRLERLYPDYDRAISFERHFLNAQ